MTYIVYCGPKTFAFDFLTCQIALDCCWLTVMILVLVGSVEYKYLRLSYESLQGDLLSVNVELNSILTFIREDGSMQTILVSG